MKLFLLRPLVFICSIILLTGCQKEEEKQPEVSLEDIQKLYYYGVNGHAAEPYTEVYDNGTSVEGWQVGDIFVSKKELYEWSESKEKAFRTNYTLNKNKIYTIAVSNKIPGKQFKIIKKGITRFNSLGLSIKFKAINGNRGDIFLKPRRGKSLGSASFPRSNGTPGRTMFMNPEQSNNEYLVTFMHELGHAVGLRHADWKTRATCRANDRGSEGAGGGAFHIPGTDNSGDLRSGTIMTACGKARPFYTLEDQKAFLYLYGN